MGFYAGHHAKYWETAALAQAIEDRGLLKPGKHGLGMGVGKEELVSLFAKYGVNVTATDQDPNTKQAKQWDNGQLTNNKNELFYSKIVDKKSFNELVDYQPYDMLKTNKKFINKYDFIWHNCVIGHLGSMKASVDHLIRSGSYLKEKGWLIFTTELNISSFEKTVDKDSDTIVWRLKDLDKLFDEMSKNGLVANRFQLRLYSNEIDTKINYSPLNSAFTNKTTMSKILNDKNFVEAKIPFSNYAITQILLCFQKKSNKPRLQSRLHKIDSMRNKIAINKFRRLSPDLNDYYQKYSEADYSAAVITPEKKVMKITIKAGSKKEVILRYKNDSNMRLFDYGLNTPYDKTPLVLATANPTNRDSSFKDKSWFSGNRPTVQFENPSKKYDSTWNSHRARPGEKLEFKFNINAGNKKGVYKEDFVLVFEGKNDIPKSTVEIKINVI